MKLRFVLHCVGVLAPGIESLAALHALRRGTAPAQWSHTLDVPSAAALPANERRRASSVVRLTLACAEQALRASPFPADALRMVFAADEGTGEVLPQMLDSLVTTRQVSPLLFHNSVHNAPAGYCSIAYRNRRSATSVSMGTESFACGLLCAVTETNACGEPVLLLAYDAVMSEPLLALHPVSQPTATAWILSAPGIAPAGAHSYGEFTLSLRSHSEVVMSEWPAWLPPDWRSNSSVQSLRALAMLDAARPCKALDFALGSQILRLE